MHRNVNFFFPNHTFQHILLTKFIQYWEEWYWYPIAYFPNISSVQSLSHVWLFTTPWTAACQTSLSITNSQSSLKLMSIVSVMPSSHLILCRPLLLLLPIPPRVRDSSSESTHCMRWPCWSFSTGVSALASLLPKNSQGWSPLEWTGWTSLQSRDSQESSPTPQFKSINYSALNFRHSPNLNPYMTPGKTIALTRRTFVDKLMSLFFNTLSRLVINFLPRSKLLLVSWLQSPSAVIWSPKR